MRVHHGIGLLAIAAAAGCAQSGDSAPLVDQELGARSQECRTSLPQIEADMICEEIAGEYQIDPVLARELVPPNYELFLYPESGMAQLNLVIEDCSQLDLDGVALAPLQNLLVWIRVEGPFELIEVPGTVQSLPTIYWYNINNFSTSAGLMSKLKEYGLPAEPVASLDLPPLEEIRTATMIEQGQAVTKFTAESVLLPQPIPLGVHFRILSERGSITSSLSATCVLTMGAQSSMTVESDPRAYVGSLFGGTLHGIGTAWTPVDCEVIWNSSRGQPE